MENAEFVEALANEMHKVWESFNAHIDVANLLVWVVQVP